MSTFQESEDKKYAKSREAFAKVVAESKETHKRIIGKYDAIINSKCSSQEQPTQESA